MNFQISQKRCMRLAALGEPYDIAAGSLCSAVGYMDRLSYGGFFEEVEKRHAAGDRQAYCKNCKLAQWPEEQRTCPNFVRSEELEAFYAEENAQSQATKPAPDGSR